MKKGQRVKANQILLALWNDDLQAQAQLAQEQFGTAKTHSRQACMQADLAEKEAERSQIEQSRSLIDAAHASLRRMVLRAPFAGVVADISGELGEYATRHPDPSRDRPDR